MKAVIMAGGKGTRLRPLTCAIPKPLVPLLGKPVMAYGLELLKRHGIRDIAVTLQYLPDAIRNYFEDGTAYGVNLHYFEEETPLGTAGSVKERRGLPRRDVCRRQRRRPYRLRSGAGHPLSP
jgi:Nucleoside-diphosphate-sugar pyrophosphorylase involved in lipopolysaccharide biosynthesis/translation initiation factor 2B, gamma/epsilon subunits (eIF-2Bgamma/eIF-2Bepsilon)